MWLVRSIESLTQPWLLCNHNIARRWIVEHGEFCRPETFDLVAQTCGLLEVEIGGGFTHAGLEIRDDCFEIVADGRGFGELASPGGAGCDQHVVALVHAVKNIGDAFAYAFRRDSIRLVVILLLLATAVGFLDRALH